MTPSERAARRQYLLDSIAECELRACEAELFASELPLAAGAHLRRWGMIALDRAERYRRELLCLDHNSAKEKV